MTQPTQLSPQTVQMLLARRNPELTRSLVQSGHVSPAQAQASLAAPGAVLNGQPTAVAGDAVLGPTSLPPIGAGPPITPYRDENRHNQQQLPRSDVQMQGPGSKGQEAPWHATGATLNDRPVDTVGDLPLGSSEQPQDPRFLQALQAQGLQAPPPPSAPNPLAVQLQPGAPPSQQPPLQGLPLGLTAPMPQRPAARESPAAVQDMLSGGGAINTKPESPQVAQHRLASMGVKPPTPAAQADKAVFADTTSQGGGAAAVAPLRPVPAHTLSLVDPAVAAQEQAGIAGERAGRVGEAEAEVGANRKLAETYGNQAGQEMIHEVEANAKARNLRRLSDEHAQSMEADRQAMGSAKPDYNRLFRGRPVLGFLGAVAQAFGAVGASITHGPNHAAQILQDRVDRDVAEQRAEYEHKKDSLQAKHTIFAEKMKLLGDPNAAEDAAKAHGYNAITLLAKREATLANSPVLESRIQTISGLMDQKMAEKNAAMTQRVQAGYAGGLGAGAGGISAKDQADIFKDPMTGESFRARNDVSRKALAESSQTTDIVSDLAQKYAAAIEKLNVVDKVGGKVGLNSVNMAEATTIYNDLQSITRKAQKDGVWRKAQVPLFEHNIAPPTRLIGGQGPAQAAKIADMARAAHQAIMQAEAPLPVKTGWGRDAHGQVVPTASYTGSEYRPPARLPERGQVQ